MEKALSIHIGLNRVDPDMSYDVWMFCDDGTNPHIGGGGKRRIGDDQPRDWSDSFTGAYSRGPTRGWAWRRSHRTLPVPPSFCAPE